MYECCERGVIFLVKERLNKIREGLSLLKEAGVIASVTGDGIKLEIITEDLSVSYDSDKLLKIKLEEAGTEIDLTEYSKLRNIYFIQGMPVINMDLFPKKFVMYPENIKIKYGE